METLVHIGGRKAINPQNVLSLKADINYTTVYFLDGSKKETVATTLKKIEAKFLPYPNFFRITKSTIINLDFVNSISNNVLTMNNGDEIIPSRRRGKVFFESVWGKTKDLVPLY
jgi:DNA-binding LytR/AlgR family response regulator